MKAQLQPVDFVNTMVGTAACDIAPTSLFGQGTEVLGQTLPAVLVPNGQTFWTPQTRPSERKCVAPYYYDDKNFMGFRASHWIVGGCTQDYGSATVMMTTHQPTSATPFRHQDETSTPYFYSILLPDEQLTAQLTGQSHTALFRYIFHQSATAFLRITVNSDTHEGRISYDETNKRILCENPVHRLYQGRGQLAGFSGWTVIQLPPSLTVHRERLQQQADDRLQELCLSFSVGKDDTVLLKAGTSFRSIDGALHNMETEMPHWNFDQARRLLRERWNRHLLTVEVEDTDTLAMSKFYTALYHASFLPRLMSDEGEEDYYTDFSMWDTYRALHPLLVLLRPKKDGEMMQSLVRFSERRGWLPIFPCWDSYTAAMIGDHCIAALSDAWVKGVHNFDIGSAYRFMRQNAFLWPRLHDDYKDGKGRRALKSYLKYGYIPLEDEVKEAYHTREQTSRTLEYAFDDFCLAQVARMLGKTKDARQLERRAQNWRHTFAPQTGYVQGRHADGRFVQDNPFELQSYITEGAPCHYSFYVPHDVPGLVTVMGGKERFLAKLDTLFAGMIPNSSFSQLHIPSISPKADDNILSSAPPQPSLYWHGNEPCHQIPYLYALVGEWQKTQAVVRHIMQREYRNTPGGLSGNDDAGQMSAWYVFSALGFYPVCPGTPDYVLGAPAFRRAVIHLENGRTFTILRDTPPDTTPTAVYLNGKLLNVPVISHQQILEGGTMRFADHK